MAEKIKATENEIQEALAFYRNAKNSPKLKSAVATVRESPCNSNCECYVELEITKAAGIAGYRYGS